MKPLDNPNAEFGVKIYLHPCDSVLDMVSILKHSKNFTQFREMIYNGFSLYSALAALQPWAEDTSYDKKLEGIIKRL